MASMRQTLTESHAQTGEPERGVYQQHDGTMVYGHGDFQRLICSFTIVALVVLQCHNHSFALLTRPVDHWCQSPSTFANFSVPKWKEVGIPLDEERHPSQCLAYLRPGGQPNDTETYECDAWDYDPARAAQSVISFWNLVCRRSWLVYLGNAVYMTGAAVVVPVAGFLADNQGRKTVIIANVVVLLTSITATCLTRTYSFYLVARFLNSASASSIFVISLTLLYEVTPVNYRVSYISLTCALGAYVVDVLLFVLASFPLSWTMLQMVVLSPTLFLVLSAWAVHESPVWLLAASRLDEAEAVMLKAAGMNNITRVVAKHAMQRIRTEHTQGQPSAAHGSAFGAPTVEINNRHIALVLTLALVVTLGIYSLSWSKTMRKETTATAVAIILSAPAYVAMFIGLVCLGRLQLLYLVMSLLGGTCSLCSVAIYAKPRLVGDILLVFAQCCARVLVPCAYLYVTELFPTGARCAFLCCAYACGRLGAVVASALSLLDDADREDLKFAIVGFALLSGVAAMHGLPETSYGLFDKRAAEADKHEVEITQYTLDTATGQQAKEKPASKTKWKSKTKSLF